MTTESDVEPHAGAGHATTLGNTLTLPPTTSSTPTARHWVTEHMAGLPVEVRDSAALLVSELVTNAVLHADTPVVVSVHRFWDRVRVDVADGDPMAPSPRGYEVDAATGRGLPLLDLLPSAWGVQPVPGGKIVWFELPLDIPLDLVDDEQSAEHYRFDLRGPAQVAAALERAGAGAGAKPPGEGSLDPLAGALPLMEIRAVAAAGTGLPIPDTESMTDLGLLGVFGLFVFELKGVPPRLMQQATEHYEALFREFRLIVEQDDDPTDPRHLPAHLRTVICDLGTRFSGFGWPAREQWLAALEDGRAEVDLSMALPTDAGPICRRFDYLLDEADQHCRAADLITLPADHACTAFRHWVLNEAAQQAAGHPPQRWARSRWSRGVRRSRLTHPSWTGIRRRA